MDILVSSNLERLLYLVSGQDSELVASLMKQLNTEGHYTVPAELKAAIDADFWGDFADDAITSAAIDKVWKNYGYLCDTHTAVGWQVAENYVAETGDHTPMVVLSTASPYKFPAAVLSAIGGDTSGDEFEQMERLSAITGVAIPGNLTGLKELPELHTGVIDKEDMLSFVLGE
jgi:threonine synthase